MAPVSISSADSGKPNDVNVNPEETDTDVFRSRGKESKTVFENGATNESHSENIESSVSEDTDLETEDEKGEHDVIVDESTAPDGGWGWCIVIGAVLLRTVIGGLGRSHGLFFLKFMESFHGTATSTALVTSLTGFIRLSAGPAVSILCGRFRCRILTSVGTIALFLGLILTGFSPNLQFLYFSYGVVAGLGRAFSLTPVPILLGHYFNKRRSLAYGIASAGFSIGGFAITPIVELLFQNYGYRGTFLILSGFALNILVASALFRPIELHRKLTSLKRKTERQEVAGGTEGKSLVFKSLEQMESGAVLGSSTVSINRLHFKSSDGYISSISSSNKSKTQVCSTERFSVKYDKHGPVTDTESDHKVESATNDKNRSNTYTNKNNNKKPNDIKALTRNNISKDTLNAMAMEANEQKETLLQTNDSKITSCPDKGEKEHAQYSWCCRKRRSGYENEDSLINKKTKSKLISWSVLKDTRFQCFLFATFCFTLQNSSLFLPALAKSKGVSDIQAATLLSISAGFDTVFRVLSGIVLDLKRFRSVRPQIYNGVAFLQGIIAALFPLMTNFSEFMTLSAIDGAVTGIKMAQGTVIMLDMLGVDKLASSLAVTMTVQCVAIIVGPTISGQLIDRYGSYDGAFYFGSGAILLGGLVMACGNLANHCRDKKVLDNENDPRER